MTASLLLSNSKSIAGKFKHSGKTWSGIRCLRRKKDGSISKAELSRWSGCVGDLKAELLEVAGDTDVVVVEKYT